MFETEELGKNRARKLRKTIIGEIPARKKLMKSVGWRQKSDQCNEGACGSFSDHRGFPPCSSVNGLTGLHKMYWCRKDYYTLQTCDKTFLTVLLILVWIAEWGFQWSLRIWAQPGKPVPGSHLPTRHTRHLNRAQSKAPAGPAYAYFRTPSPFKHSYVVPTHNRRKPQLRPPPQRKEISTQVQDRALDQGKRNLKSWAVKRGD